MFPKSLTITVTSAANECLLEQALTMARDLKDLANVAPEGQILDQCEAAAVEKGRDFTRQALAQAVAQRLDTAQKKGRSAAVPADFSRAQRRRRPNGPDQPGRSAAAAGVLPLSRLCPRGIRRRCLLGVHGYLTTRLQRLACLAGADPAFAPAALHSREFLVVMLSAEKLRRTCHAEAK